jgi:NAD(P)-dependent dehydrogenase (short-subunit alcohol dehydrogenase family)
MAEVCLIVGAGPGIGQACARTFARAGYDIALASRRPERLNSAVSEVVTQTGRRAKAFGANAGDESSLVKLVSDVRAALGDPSILIFNAAGATMGRPTTIPPARLLEEFRANVVGALILAEQVAPAMKAAGRGTILLTGGGFAQEPSSDYASLSLCKAALRNLTYSLAQELGGAGIHVATVTVHGFVQTGTHYDPERIAQNYLRLHRQPKGNFEIEAVYK